jgi:uncharacterized membrane protein
MDMTLSEWLHIALRWIHVFAGILWVGQTYLFTWLDHRLAEAHGDGKDGGAGEVWMVHSGGFYVVNKQLAPGAGKVHWFRFEALVTWVTGLLLLILVYYYGGMMVDEGVSPLSPTAGIVASLGILVGGFVVYDLLWLSPLGKREALGTVVSYLLLVGVIYASSRLFSARAAYLQVGAMLGTIMAANVWVRILPAQRKMLTATSRGEPADQVLAARAKGRSKHNTFMVVPVIFIMLSSHFPTVTFGHAQAWIILAGLVLVGFAAAKVVREHK